MKINKNKSDIQMQQSCIRAEIGSFTQIFFSDSSSGSIMAIAFLIILSFSFLKLCINKQFSAR